MFAVGDMIIYGGTGVCRVNAVAPLAGSRGPDRKRLYYTLKPCYGTETIYVPVDTKVFMRKVITREEAERLIDRIPELEPDICNERNLRVLSDHYKANLETHSCEDLLQTVKAVWLKGAKAVEQKRKPGQVDQYFGKRAEELLYGELAVALGMPFDDVKPYITARVKVMEEKK